MFRYSYVICAGENSTHLVRIASCVVVALLISTGCFSAGPASQEDVGVVTITFTHGKISGDPRPLENLIAEFEVAHPTIRVRDEPLPSSTDQQHQLYAINLEGGSGDIDVLAMDVIWVPEFSRARWIQPLDSVFTPAMQADFIANAIDAVTYGGMVWAVPWNIDAGLLYYRKDLLRKYNRPPPRTWDELIETANVIMHGERDQHLHGFVWQGRQYEGLICDAMEFIWGNGGHVLQPGTGVADLTNAATVDAVSFMRDIIHRHGVSPAVVTTSDEEATRHMFGMGRAIFMRNWPYAWVLLQRGGSRVQGKVGIAPLPTFGSHPQVSTLGGWHLGIAKHSQHPEEAWKFIKFLTSHRAQQVMALQVGIQASRTAVYQDRELNEAQPFLAVLQPMLFSARPRPVTPFYPMVSQILQSEFSAVLANVREPHVAMRSAERQINHALRVGELQ